MYLQSPLLQYILLKNIDNVRGILEDDAASASILDSDKKTPLHAAAFAGTKETAGMYEGEIHQRIWYKLGSNCLLENCHSSTNPI